MTQGVKMNFKIIKEKVTNAKDIAIFTHIIPDGDAIGSSCALAQCLQNMGKTAKVYIQEKLSDEFEKLGIEDLITYDAPKSADLVIITDCSNSERIGAYEPFIKESKNSIAIDHHIAFDNFAVCNFLNAKSCSACEFLFDIFTEIGFKIDKRMAELLYLGIIRDSGGFMYNNTTAHSHVVVAKLFDLGVDFESINRQYMSTITMKGAMVLKAALNNLVFFEDNRFAMSTISVSELQKIDASINDTGAIVNQILSIEPVEVAVLATEVNKNVFKVSIRSKYDIDANLLAQKFGGGGHKKAAGCQLFGTREKISEELLKIMREHLKG